MNVAESIRAHAIATPDRSAVRLDDLQWSYRELWERTAGTADQLTKAGIGPGCTVLLIQRNHPSFFSSYYGILGAGASVVLANTMATRVELTHIAVDSEAVAIIAGETCGTAASLVADELNLPKLATDAKELRAWAKTKLSSYKVPRLVRLLSGAPSIALSCANKALGFGGFGAVARVVTRVDPLQVWAIG